MIVSPGDYRLILGTRIDATSYQDACEQIQIWAHSHTSCYLVAANVHVVMMGHWHQPYQQIVNHAALVTPDGTPLVWAMRILGIKGQGRVYGPDLMLAVCQRASQQEIPIYLYGGTKSMLGKLRKNLEASFPGLKIVGTHAPPFRALTPEEEAGDREKIEKSGAKIVFVGLGCPKQEKWMHRQRGQLRAVMIGVGAAFSFHSGEVSQAPRWMMKLGLEWLYRLASEPRRLWKRYLINNPSFLCLFAWQLLRRKQQNQR